ncbi:UV damage repair endonuclease UvdE [Paenibacillus swuensis]|uniref:UV damage repair endonuclease UvdE n=1 Tax=Paenibacillus swuensis TaxID=1178515 RepID=A0A172TJ15_9BACL|nr:UV DNA damage repair endonuclease UvsE [Paenibacillus swuensis]ANE46956.1 UV damage repair endonuclease UvdE [Paenibacillus swuensis]
MIVRLGFVSIALGIFNNTASSTFTYKLFSQRSREDALKRAIEVGHNNLRATQRILYFNAAHGVKTFRLSSQLVPLATHPDVMLDVGRIYKKELKQLGAYARKEGIRLTMHPNQFTLLNGSDAVVAAAIHDLEYHAAILDGMGMDESGVINIHIGGVYGDKSSAVERLYANWELVPEHVKRRLTFENDDKTYTLEETLAVCERIRRPLVLDLHHDWCNPSEITAISIINRIQSTWGDIPMKIHVSSPKSEKEFRAHADYVDPEPLSQFLKACKEAGLEQIDVVVEAKMKDFAVFKLAEDLGKIRGVKRLDGAVLEW